MRFLSLLIITFLAVFHPYADAQTVAAPAVVENQAKSDYVSSLNGQDGLVLSNTVRANLVFEQPFSIVKTALTPSPTEGDTASYEISVTRTPAGIAYPTAITLDHVARSLYLITDRIPVNTTFKSVDEAADATILYHLRGSAENAYTATVPADLATIDGVASAYPDFAPGVTRKVKLTLSILPAATGTVVNVATVRFINKDLVAEGIDSPASGIILGKTRPGIRYYNQSYEQVQATVLLGSNLHIEVVWAAGNADPTKVDRGTITLISKATGDEETFEIVETGPDTGIFRIVGPVPTRSGMANNASKGNGIMETVEGDVITARLNGSTVAKIETTIRVESVTGGIVFDSKKNTPIAGAKVTLIDMATGSPAVVYDFDGKTRLSPTVTTGNDGRYQFPTVPNGSYRVQVEPLPGHQFTSTVRPGDLPKGRNIDAKGSYGYPFQRQGSEGYWFDIPCDPVGGGGAGLFIDKAASRGSVEIGETLSYTVRVKNVYGSDLSDIIVTDKLPFGFRYIKNSAAVEGRRIADPSISNASLVFQLGELKSDATISLTYRVRVTVGAKDGDAINRAEARDTREKGVHSNRTEAHVQIVPGVFTDKGIIFGKIYVDLNKNKMQDEGEVGIPGVRLYLEDGSYVVTDAEGKYSFYGISPRLHVVKVDNTTLPAGTKLEILSNRNAGDAGSRFVDLIKGEMHKADFADASGDPAVLENVMRRRESAESSLTEIESNLHATLMRESNANAASKTSLTGGSSTETATTRVNQDVRALPASGIIGVGAVAYQQGSNPDSLGLTNAPDDAAMPRREVAAQTPWSGSLVGVNSGADLNAASRRNNTPGRGDLSTIGKPLDITTPKTVIPVAPAIPMESSTVTDEVGVGFLDLKEGDTLTMAQATIRVKGSAAGVIALSVNGEAVPDQRIGKKIIFPGTQIQGVEYIGVPLRVGPNRLTVEQRDTFGNVRGQASITVIAPGKLGKIVIEPLTREARADGKTPVGFTVRILDADGVPVSARTAVTLQTTVGTWNVKDLNPTEPGVQVFVQGGKGEFTLAGPLEPCDAIVRASAGALAAETQVAFLPELRPMIAAGVVEGRVDFSELNTSFGRRSARDSFQDELKGLSLGSGVDDPAAAARTAFFMKGQVYGEYVLTAAYDSDKDRKERLFRDIQPDEFYPIYGDSSLKGFDAQSTSSAYAKIENKKSYLLYGDYVTQSNSDLRSLGNYNRSLTGAQYHFESSRISANAWASYDNTRQIIEELPANGTSGPFAFRVANGLINSEKVEILTRSRSQPALIISTVSMTRFTDYQFEPFSGRILFKSPIASVDENLNPISIRITYEADQGGDKFWVYGADAQVRATDWLELGGSAVDDTNPFAPYRLFSANSAVKLSKNTFVLGEVALSEAPFETGNGHAERLELRHQGERLTGRVYWSRADRTFLNPAASLTAGRVEAGAQLAYRIDAKTSLHLEAINTESVEAGARRGVLGEVSYAFSDKVRLDVGGRYSTDSGDPYGTAATTAAVDRGSVAPVVNQADIASVRAKLTVPFPFLPNGSFYGEYENDLVDIERRVAALGVEYQASAETKLYAKHEFISSLDGQFDLNSSQQKNTTVVGVQSAYMQGGQLFNEYRVRDAISGRESEGAVGLRNSYTLFDGLQVQATFERVAPLVIGRKVEGRTGVDGRPLTQGAMLTNESTAITGAFDYTAPEDWKATGRGEYRTSKTEDAWLFTLGYARRLDENQSMLGKLIYDQMSTKGLETGSGDRRQFRLQLGYAYRPVNVNFWNFLTKYELKLENDGTLVDLASNRVVHIVSADVNWQPTAYFTFSGHYAAKLATESGNGMDSTEFANLIGLRGLIDLSERWDAGLNVRLMFDANGRIQYGAGPELGFRFKKNMRLAAGYNFFGFHDKDFSADNYTQKGVYLSFNMKFDENLLNFGKSEAGE